jgi:DNA-directed RNA polymerase specialized sigma24 family protein
MSYDEVSSKLGISRNTIKEHMVLAMRFIKDYLKTRSLP